MRYEVAAELAKEAAETFRGARELQAAAVREMAASGLGTAEIAQRLSVAAATVRGLFAAPAVVDQSERSRHLGHHILSKTPNSTKPTVSANEPSFSVQAARRTPRQ